MALITCPECKGRVSDQASVCIHCGYPLDKLITENDNTLYKIILLNPHDNIMSNGNQLRKAKEAFSKIGIRENEHLKIIMNKTNGLLEEGLQYYRLKKDEEILQSYGIKYIVKKMDDNTQFCPKCGSTSIEPISVGTKTGGLLFALIGQTENEIQNYCKSCGYKWKP